MIIIDFFIFEYVFMKHTYQKRLRLLLNIIII